MTALYVPPTDEADHKKQNQSIQLIGGVTSTNTANIATLQALVPAPTFTNALSADVTLNSITTYFTGPSVAQGTAGTWFASGSVTVFDTGGAAASFAVKLWDGTTVIASTKTASPAGGTLQIALSGILANPAGNIRISVKDTSATTGKILFNQSGESKDSTVSVIRIA